MKILSVLAICSLLLFSCNNRYKFWDISKFNIVESALKDNEEIKILYTTRGPGNNEDLEYYIHLIAVSQKTGDTVNILTPVDNGLTMDDQDKVFNYFDQNNPATKMMFMNPENLKDIEKIRESQKSVPKKITKVVRDTHFDMIADNNYPTVIGAIGTVTK